MPPLPSRVRHQQLYGRRELIALKLKKLGDQSHLAAVFSLWGLTAGCVVTLGYSLSQWQVANSKLDQADQAAQDEDAKQAYRYELQQSAKATST